MIQAIVGRKGSGKTKRLLDMANEALKVEHGHIVFVDDDKRYMYDLRHEIRFVDASEYMPKEHRSPDALIALLGGMLAADYDITLICVDAFHRLCAIARRRPYCKAYRRMAACLCRKLFLS